MIKLFSTQSKTITGAAIILGAASFISRLIGILRDRVFAHLFGAGETLDAYYAAFRIPDLVYNLIIVGALSAGFIPIFTSLLAKDKAEAWRVTNSVINILGLVLILLSLILFIFTPKLMPFLVPGFSSDNLALTVTLTRLMFLSPLLLGISGIVSGVLQSFKSFFIYALTPIVYNLGIIFGAFFLVPVFGPVGLAFGVILGAILHLAIQLPTFFNYGFRYRPDLLLKNENVREIGKLMLPRALGLATTQLNLLVITLLASTVGPGSISIFNFANNIQLFPVGVIGISFAIAAFPTLSALAAAEKKDMLILELAQAVRQIIFFIVPISLIFLLLRAQIVRVILGSGQFDWAQTIATANTLAFFTFSLLPQAIIPILARAYFALRDTWTPFLIGLIGSLINILGGLYFKNRLGIGGLALAYSLAMTAQVILLWLVLRSRLCTLHESRMFLSFNKIAGAALLMAIFMQILKMPLAWLVDMTKLWGVLTQGALTGLAGLAVYALVCRALRLSEMLDFGASLKRRFIKLKNVQRGEITEADEV